MKNAPKKPTKAPKWCQTPAPTFKTAQSSGLTQASTQGLVSGSSTAVFSPSEPQSPPGLGSANTHATHTALRCQAAPSSPFPTLQEPGRWPAPSWRSWGTDPTHPAEGGYASRRQRATISPFQSSDTLPCLIRIPEQPADRSPLPGRDHPDPAGRCEAPTHPRRPDAVTPYLYRARGLQGVQLLTTTGWPPVLEARDISKWNRK